MTTMVVDVKTNDNDNTCPICPSPMQWPRHVGPRQPDSKDCPSFVPLCRIRMRDSNIIILNNGQSLSVGFQLFYNWLYSFDCGEGDAGDVMLHEFCNILRKYKFILYCEKKNLVRMYLGALINSAHTD